jgi:phenylalanyl-tRNA synthetase beta chain
VERVLALLLPAGVQVGAVEELLRSLGGDLLEQVSVESDYRGPELLPDSRSVAFRLTFRAPDRTLRDAEVDAAEARLLDALAADLAVRRRDAGTSRAGE